MKKRVRKLTKEHALKMSLRPYWSWSLGMMGEKTSWPMNQVIEKKLISNSERHKKSKSMIQLVKVTLLVGSWMAKTSSLRQKWLGAQRSLCSS